MYKVEIQRVGGGEVHQVYWSSTGKGNRIGKTP
jgi:hypothetical protein